jgi:Na+-driven multidrug efflux pump
LGSDTVAVVNVAMKIQIFITQPLEALGVTMATYCGQNSGAGRLDRIYSGIKKSYVLAVACSVLGLLIVFVGVGPMSELFMKKSEMTDYIRSSIRQMMIANGCFYILLGSLLILRYSLQGLGHSVVAMGAGVFEMVGRCLVAFIGVSGFGFTAVCFANPVAWLGANLLLVPVFIWVMHKKSKELKALKSV